MSTLNRTGAHAALFSGTTLDRLEFEQLAHDIVDDLCNVTDAVAAQAAAHSHASIHRHRSSTSTPPSNETEKELLQARRVKALEAIATALTTIAKKDTP
jgi:hypothetical protein